MSKLLSYFFLLAVLISSCSAGAEPKSKTLVLDYQELGPSSATYEIVGNGWYQWNNHGDSDPRKFDDIKVVVYRNVSLDEVKKTYPVDKGKLMDYRYLAYETAMDFLSKNEDEPYLERLKDTKKKIIETLGS